VGNKRETKLAPAESVPVDRHALGAALTLFVTRFVVEDKRDQLHKRLLTRDRRGETLVAVARWIHGTKAPLEGADRSPAGLRTRFGELVGIYLDEDAAKRTTIDGALELGRARASVFIGDTGRIALITSTDGPPLLCSWP
jgi:hypothetical protein